MKRRLHITMTYNLFNWIKVSATAHGLSVSGFINYHMKQIQKEETMQTWEQKIPMKKRTKLT